MGEIIGGIIFILAGISTLVTPVRYDSKYAMTFDFTRIKYPLSFGIMAVGAFCIFIGWRSKTNDKYKAEYWICPQCEKMYWLTGKDKHVCPECEMPLEKLKGFYERHPELKKKK